MAFDEPADLIGSYEASLDVLGLLVGDLREEVQEMHTAQIARWLTGRTR